MIMQAMCARQAPRRIRYQPLLMNRVLMKLNVALTAGSSEIVSTLNLEKVGTSIVYRCDY